MIFDTDRLSHAYIIDESFADTLAMAVVCSTRGSPRPCRSCIHCDKSSRHIHPDITVVGKLEDKLIVSVDQIRELKRDVYIVPNEAIQKAYVVNDADAMNANAQNAFLQVLEEPPAHAVFILCTNNPAALLPTVRSRCVELRSHAFTDSDESGGLDESGFSEDSGTSEMSGGELSELERVADEFVSALAGDNVKLMECMFRLDKLDRISFSGFLGLAREKVALSLRNGSLVYAVSRADAADAAGVAGNSRALVRAEGVLAKAGEMLDLNVSSGHIAGYICAGLVI